ncbi:MAG: hypothetical protein JWR47_1472 [Phenylobacterium sp.]|jgi:hypothetical protein|nr:hypothetical protein [Phenylobacterium sp.]MDB5435215.1 hypothetical protein [Phenylobacterium sp.]MDB5462265.1 hypothetical protein [Phenylobacterium sp.]
MLNLRRAVAGLAAAAILAGTPALGAEAATPNPHSVELARKLFTEMHMDQLMGNMLRQMGPTIIAQSRKNNPNLTPQDAKVINDAVAESMDSLMQKVVDRSIPLYASTFSEKELQDLVDFYDSPSGRAMLAKMPVLMSKMTPMMTELMPEIAGDINRRVCSRIDCSKRAAPTAPKG